MRRATGRLAQLLNQCRGRLETCTSPCAALSELCGRSFMHGRTDVYSQSSVFTSLQAPHANLEAVQVLDLAPSSSRFLRGYACGKDSDEPVVGASETTESKDSEETDTALKVAADSGGMSELLRVVEQRSERLSERNVVTSFAYLAKLAHGKSEGQLEDIHGEAPYLALVDVVILGVQRFDEEQLLSILGACAKLGYDHDMLMDTVTTRLLQRMGTLGGPQLLDLATSLAEAEYSPSVILFDAIQGRAEELGKAVTNEMKKELQNAYSKLGYYRLTNAVENLLPHDV